MYIIDRKDINILADKISEKFPLYLPLSKNGEVNFGLYTKGDIISLDTLKTVKSPKELFFPQSETLMKFKTSGKAIEIDDIREEEKPFVLMGVKACDYKAFDVLDKVFLAEPVDTFYKEKREAGIIFTLACSKPEESCFCKALDIDATSPSGDVTTYLDEENLYFEVHTKKGEEVIDYIKEILKETSPLKVEAQKQKTKEIIEKLPYSNIDLSYFKNGELNEIFNRPEWQKLSEACLACGTCTFVCPTCQCFDIRDYKTNKGILRYRCWDSCMYSDFTQMAAANNRTTQMQRYRQRFMHKLVYYPAQHNGLISCVGCGRCVNKCPQHLNIIKVIKTMGGEK